MDPDATPSIAPLAEPGAAATVPSAVGRAEAFRFWFRLGCVSFGGPAGQIALMHEELVERRRWISEGRFLHALNYCMVLPGPEAQQLATYIGWLLHRTTGGVVAGALFVLPSLFVLVALSAIYMAWGAVPAIAGVFHGIKPAVTALVVHAAWRIGARALKSRWHAGIALAAFIAIVGPGVPFPAIVLAAGVVGAIGGRVSPERFRSGGGHGGAAADGPRALIDDDTPAPAHARFAWRRCLAATVSFLASWAVAMGGLLAAFGSGGTLPRMGWFFTKAALLTFGGAYAVLPYVYQGAVDQAHWITAAQMMDGLALGETTPGPLIMVVAFVGFVGGWTQGLPGVDAPFLAGTAAAVVVTFFTFLPSFLFVLAGGPFIESTRGRLGFAAPLSGITAAVVGVIASLGVFFAAHVLWPRGPGGGLDVVALVIGAAAAVALFRYKVGVIPVVVACGLAGLACSMVA